MAYSKTYDRIKWENEPSIHSPINEINLNKMDKAIDVLDERTVELDSKVETLGGYETRAAQSEINAGNSATQSANSALQSSNSASEASTSATQADNSAKLSKSYAVGDTGIREGEDEDNSKYYKDLAEYWYNRCKTIAESFAGGLRPMGTITFDNLPSTNSSVPGDMYNISDEFTSTEDFMDGSGISYPRGSNVYLTLSYKWDVLTGVYSDDALVTIDEM